LCKKLKSANEQVSVSAQSTSLCDRHAKRAIACNVDFAGQMAEEQFKILDIAHCRKASGEDR
jgi:hypothetical protein